jgi:radical SAM superfamily enzyme YgiQ (UPF0313 family)
MKIAFISMDPKGAPVRGAGYVAASIPSEHEMSFYCMMNPISDIKYIKLPKLIVNGKYDIVMVSTTTTLYLDASRLIKDIKAVKDIPVLMGGVHPTVVGSKLLKDNNNIDYLCIGEGESFIKDFLNHYGKDSLFEINNLAYVKDGEIYSNQLNPPEDLSKLPQFPWHLFHRVVNPDGTLNVTATRGCPYSCTYCCNSTFLKMYGKSYIRHRPVEHVIEELKDLRNRYAFKRLHFGDDMILFDAKYVKGLFTLLKSELNVPYWCMSRVECIDEEMVDLLKRTGCKSVSMGIECGDELFRRKYLNRFMSNDQIRKAFKLLKKADIGTISFNMIGWPFENDDKLTKITADFNKELDPDFVQVTWFYPFPGTKLYDYCVENDLINKSKSPLSYHSESILKGYENKKSFFKSHRRR